VCSAVAFVVSLDKSEVKTIGDRSYNLNTATSEAVTVASSIRFRDSLVWAHSSANQHGSVFDFVDQVHIQIATSDV
jgi:hypothetical protein